MPPGTSKTRLTGLLLTLLAVTGCVGSPVIVSANTPCTDLVPAEWRKGVEHAPPPAQAADPLAQLKAWIGFGTAEAAQLEKANGRTIDALGIVERCQARDAAAVKRSKPRFLGVF
jgi:hypothetical protein